MKAVKLEASWCGPCKMLTQQLDQRGIKIEVNDIDEDSSLARQHGVRGVPTILILNDDGTEVERFVGASLTDAQFEKLKELSI